MKVWKEVMSQVPRAKTFPSGLEWVNDPPPLAVPVDESKVPEPVNWVESPASIGVPGMFAEAMAVFGPIRLNEQDVLVVA